MFFPPSDWKVALAEPSVMMLTVHWLANSSTLLFQSDLPITAQNFSHIAAPQKGCAWPTSTREHCSQQCLLLLLQGWLELFSKQLAPVREQWESCKCTADSCYFRSWSEGETDRGEGNHLQFTCPCAACIFPHHSDTEKWQSCRWYQQVL